MPEASVARGRAGGGLAPQEGFLVDENESFPQLRSNKILLDPK